MTYIHKPHKIETHTIHNQGISTRLYIPQKDFKDQIANQDRKNNLRLRYKSERGNRDFQNETDKVLVIKD